MGTMGTAIIAPITGMDTATVTRAIARTDTTADRESRFRSDLALGTGMAGAGMAGSID